jgi:hypothetical protein
MADADIEHLITRLGEILEGQALLTSRLTEAMERMTAVVTRHETRLQQCRCQNCKAFEPASYPPSDMTEPKAL